MTLKNTATKSLALVLATSFAFTAALPITAAEAGSKKHWKKHHQGHKHHKRSHKRSHKYRNNSGDALAAGVLGFALGAIIVDQVTRPRVTYVEPRPVYVAPQPVYVAPQPVYREPYVERRPLNETYQSGPKVIRYDDTEYASYEPWTPEWADWCDSNYRSFNPNTGTFRGYDGLDHFCVVK